MHELWAITYLSMQLRDLVEFQCQYTYGLREDARRLISHFGFVRFGDESSSAGGVDFTNCIYAIVWRLLLQEVPSEWEIQSIWDLNSCGNMVESLMAFAFFGPSKYEHVREYLESKLRFSERDVEEASCFVRWVVDSGKQK